MVENTAVGGVGEDIDVSSHQALEQAQYAQQLCWKKTTQ